MGAAGTPWPQMSMALSRLLINNWKFDSYVSSVYK